MGKYFGTDGIRGNANEKLTVMTALKVGRFIGHYHTHDQHKAKILIGKDTRLSSGMLESALACGISASGGDVYLLGYTSTPCLAYLTMSEDFDCGVMISASHNPYHDNGIKLFAPTGLKINDELEAKIEEYIDDPTGIPWAVNEKIGNVYAYPQGIKDYREWLYKLFDMDLSSYHILLDLANGSNCYTAREVFEHFHAHVDTINDRPDGLNINTNCGSTHLDMLKKGIQKDHYDIGFAFDGDADRVLIVNAKGEEIDGDKIMFALGSYLKQQGSLNGDAIVTTVMSNIGLFKTLKAHNMQSIITPVGDKNVVDAMLKNDYIIGGEQSGHIINLHHAPFGDGLKTALNVMEVMAKTSKTIDELTKELKTYPQLLVNVKVKDKKSVLEDEIINEQIAKVKTTLGDDGRILVRPSGTEPLIRVMVEAESDAICSEMVNSVIELIKRRGYAEE